MSSQIWKFWFLLLVVCCETSIHPPGRLVHGKFGWGETVFGWPGFLVCPLIAEFSAKTDFSSTFPLLSPKFSAQTEARFGFLFIAHFSVHLCLFFCVFSEAQISVSPHFPSWPKFSTKDTTNMGKNGQKRNKAATSNHIALPNTKGKDHADGYAGQQKYQRQVNVEQERGKQVPPQARPGMHEESVNKQLFFCGTLYGPRSGSRRERESRLLVVVFLVFGQADFF